MSLTEGYKESKFMTFIQKFLTDQTIVKHGVLEHHLDPEVRGQIKKVLKARRGQFKRTAGVTLIAPILMSIFKGPELINILPAFGVGAVIGSLMNRGAITPGEETKKLWKMIEKKDSIIDPKFKDRYPELERVSRKKQYLTLTYILGNLKLSEKASRFLKSRKLKRPLK